MMLILMLIMMLKFCVRESINLILGPQDVSLQPGWVSAAPISQKVSKSPLTPTFPTKFLHSSNFYIIAT